MHWWAILGSTSDLFGVKQVRCAVEIARCV
jgi:hypothetical protein